MKVLNFFSQSFEIYNPNIDHYVAHNFHFFFTQPGSCQMEGIINLYNYISCFLTGILFFVSTLLYFVIKDHSDGKRHIAHFLNEGLYNFWDWVKFVKSWTHSTELELIWTIIPTLILIAIAVPSFVLLYALDEIVDCPCVVKVIAYQWYWKYEYPIEIGFGNDSEVKNISYLSYMVPTEDLKSHLNYYSGNQWFRLLDVDAPLMLPHSVNTKLIITAKDVLHSFAVPSLGVKMDAVPGRLNQVTVFIIEPGIYYGQCSELCGINHAFMPIMLHSISFDCFNFCVHKLLLKDLQTTFDFSELFFSETETDSNDIFSSDVLIKTSDDLKIESSNPETDSDHENVDDIDEDDEDDFFGNIILGICASTFFIWVITYILEVFFDL